MIEKPSTNPRLNIRHGVSQLLYHRLSLKSLNSVRVGRSRHDDESDHSDLRASFLKFVVQSGERLNEHVDTLVSVFISTCGEHLFQCRLNVSVGKKSVAHVDGILKVKVIMAIEMSSNKLVDLRLRCGMHILELMHSLELDNIQSVGQHTIRFPFQQMFAFVRGDMRNGRENVSAVSSRPLDTVAVINSPLSSLMINIKVL